MKATVLIRLKQHVPDAAGREVASRLRADGFGDVDDVRIGKLIEIHLSSGDRENADQRIQDICKNLLANTHIEEIEIVGIE